MFALVLVLVGIGFASPLAAQEPSDEPPVAGRPSDFSEVVGRYRISASVDRSEVAVEEPITLTVRIVGHGPKEYQPVRKQLRIFAEDAGEQFYIEPVPDQDRILPRDNAWEFFYRLRPKFTEVRFIPGPKLVYYSPERRAYQTTYADDITVTVRAQSEMKPNVVKSSALSGPQQLFRLAAADAVPAREEARTYWTPGVLLALLFGPPLVVGVGYSLRRRLWPEDAQDDVRRRSRAARQALHDLARIRTGNSANAFMAILTNYLAQRLDFAAAEPTPAEVLQLLKRRGVAASVRRSWAEFIQSCDEARYGPWRGQEAVDAWKNRATNLIHALEADRSVSAARPLLALRVNGWLLAGACTLLSPLAVGADSGADPGSIVRAAERSFQQGCEEKNNPAEAQKCFAAAARAYAQLHALGVRSAGLYGNWGNAALLADRVPEAILAYHRGLRLAPGRADLVDNLHVARQRVSYPPTAFLPESREDYGIATLLPWPEWISRNLRLLLGLATLFFYTWSCYAAIAWYKHRPGPLPVRAVILLGLAGMFAICWHQEESALERDQTQPLVVIDQETILRQGNGHSYPAHAVVPSLSPGMEARRILERGDWLQIQLPGGAIGWVPTQAVLIDEP